MVCDKLWQCQCHQLCSYADCVNDNADESTDTGCPDQAPLCEAADGAFGSVCGSKSEVGNPDVT